MVRLRPGEVGKGLGEAARLRDHGKTEEVESQY